MQKLLHTLNKSPFSSSALALLQDFCSEQDVLILLEDGIYAVNHDLTIEMLKENISVFAIEMDVSARGMLDQYKKQTDIKLISYAQFVDLSIEFSTQKSW